MMGGDPPPPHGENQTSFSCTAELQAPPQVRLWDSRRLLAHRTYTHEQAEKKSWAWNDPEPQQKLQQCSFVLLIKILASSRASHVPKDKRKITCTSRTKGHYLYYFSERAHDIYNPQIYLLLSSEFVPDNNDNFLYTFLDNISQIAGQR